MNEIWKAIGKEALKKAEEKMRAMKFRFQLEKKIVELDVKLGETTVEFNIQVTGKKNQKRERRKNVIKHDSDGNEKGQ